MVIGGYSLDLYCDFPDEAYKHRGSPGYPGDGVGDFAAESGPVARSLARRAGWKIERGGRRALCPMCQRLGRVLPVINH